MSLPYVKLSSEEVSIGKRNVLSSQIHLLNIEKKIDLWKSIRKKELSKKIALRKAIKESLAKINSLISSLPTITCPNETRIESGEVSPKSKKGRAIESELREIREKLSKIK